MPASALYFASLLACLWFPDVDRRLHRKVGNGKSSPGSASTFVVRPLATIWDVTRSAAGIRWRGTWHAPTMSCGKGSRKNGIFRLPPHGATARRRGALWRKPWRRPAVAGVVGGGAEFH